MADSSTVDTKAALSDFYGMMLADPAPSTDEPTGNGDVGGGGDDSSYDQHDHRDYDDHTAADHREHSQTREPVDERLDVDGVSFDSGYYVETLLRESPMSVLLSTDARLLSEKRSLDSDMQMLVYENYNKFISATDMIRTMKLNVESMEREMSDLSSNMSTISSSCAQIEAALTPNRMKVENLLGVSRLLKRLEFLFELPSRLRKSIDMGAHQQAVKYFRVSANILSQYAHLKSFETIRRDSEQIIIELKQKLRSIVKAPATTISQQLETAAMLMDLSETTGQLIGDILRSRKERLLADLQRAVELHASALKRDADLKRKEETAENAANMERRNSTSTTTSRKTSDVSNHDDTTSSDTNTNNTTVESSNTTSDLIDLLEAQFITPFLLFATTYVDTILIPLQQQINNIKNKNINNNNSTTNNNKNNKVETYEKCRLELNNFTNALFNEYFAIIKKELTRKANLQISAGNIIPTSSASTSSSTAAASSSASSSSSTTTIVTAVATATAVPVPLSNAVITALITRLISNATSFDRVVRKVNALIPTAAITERASSIVQQTIHSAVDSVMQQTGTNMADILVKLHNDVTKFDALAYAASLLNADGSYNDHNAVGKSRSGLPSAALLSTRLRVCVDEMLHQIVPLATAHTELKVNNAGPAAFNELIHRKVYALLANMTALLLCRVLRVSDGPVFDPQPPLPVVVADLPAVKQLKYPLFYLYLANIALSLESKEITVALRTLKKLFPITRPAEFDGEQTVLIARLKENTQLMTGRFVEIHGILLCKALTDKLNTSLQSSSPVPACSAVVTLLYETVLSINTQLNELLPKRKDDAAQSQANGGGTIGGRGGVGSAMRTGGVFGSARGQDQFSQFASRERTVNRDIARLFAVKVATYSPVKLNRSDPLFVLYKIALKHIVETIRSSAVAATALPQIEVDVYAIKCDLPPALSAAADSDEAKTIAIGLEEIMNSATERAYIEERTEVPRSADIDHDDLSALPPPLSTEQCHDMYELELKRRSNKANANTNHAANAAAGNNTRDGE